MPRYCSIMYCNSTTYNAKGKDDVDKAEKIGMFGLPKKEETRQRWMEILATQTKTRKIGKWTTVCSKHFAPSCFHKHGFDKVKLNENAIPTIFPNSIANCTSGETSVKSEKLCKDNIAVSFVENTKHNTCETLAMTADKKIGLKENDQNNIPQCSYSYKTIRYAGDIDEGKLRSMSPRSIQKCFWILRKKILTQTKKINTLHKAKLRSARKIQALTYIVNELKKRIRLSSGTADGIVCT